MINKTPKEQAMEYLVKQDPNYWKNKEIYRVNDVEKAIDIALQAQQKEFERQILEEKREHEKDVQELISSHTEGCRELKIKHEAEIKRLRNRIEYLEKEDRPQGEFSELVVQREKIREWLQWYDMSEDNLSKLELLKEFDEFCKKELGEKK